MKVVISSGHGKYIRGASGSPVPPQLDEVDEARKVVDRVAEVLQGMGVDVITFHDNTSHDQSTNLSTIVNFHNKQSRTLDVSVHFNAYDHSAHGCEVLYKTQEKLAKTVVDKICAASGFTNRGPKYRSDLKFLNSTEEPAVLIETCFCDHTGDSNTYRDRFSEICVAIAEGLTGEEAGQQPDRPPERPPVRPPPEGPGPDADSQPTLKKGDEGEAVVRLQRSLGLPADGDFGEITDTQVRAFQAACELVADGVVGPITWGEVDVLDAKKATGNNGLTNEMESDIDRLVVASGLDDYVWDDRGSSPPGYISGMARCFAVAMTSFHSGRASALFMGDRLGSESKDALAWYADEFDEEDMDNDTPRERIRHLFVLLIGLGMRESSGKYCEGRDMSASNTSSDTCEAGLFQSSWNFHNSSAYIEEFFQEYWADPNGFLEIFSEEIYPTANNLNVYGSGDGAAYQWLAKYCPAFAVMSTAIGLRVLKDHWGPIKRHEAEIVPEVDDLLLKIQELVEDSAEVA
jgi:hypothetical protein